mgnify:CR=1 FL=1
MSSLRENIVTSGNNKQNKKDKRPHADILYILLLCCINNVKISSRKCEDPPRRIIES